MQDSKVYLARLLPISCFLLISPIAAHAEVKADASEATQSKEGESDPSKKSSLADKLKLDGFVRSLFEAEKFKDGETFHEARLEVKTKRKRGLRAEVEVDFRTKNDDIQINEAILDKKWDNGLRMKVGYDLKRFGLEYEESRLERPTIERSYIYRQMELFQYNGRETILSLEKDGDNANFHDWAMTASFSESQNFSLFGNYQTDLSFGPRYGVWVQAGTHKGEKRTYVVSSIVNAIWQRDSQKVYQAEAVVGIDPNQTEYEDIFGSDDTIYFSGFNTLYGRYFFNDGEESLMYQTGLTAVAHDQRNTAYNSLGAFLGLRYDLDTLRIALNAEMIARNSLVDLKKRTYDESTLRLEALFAF